MHPWKSRGWIVGMFACNQNKQTYQRHVLSKSWWKWWKCASRMDPFHSSWHQSFTFHRCRLIEWIPHSWMGHVVFFFLSRYLQVHNDVPAVSAADKQTYAQCRTCSSEKPEIHSSISCLGKAADLILLWEFRVVFKILNAAILRVWRLENWRRGRH